MTKSLNAIKKNNPLTFNQMPTGIYLRTEKNKGENNGQWKGHAANYATKHQWVRRHFGKPQKCEECGLNKQPLWSKISYFEWANVSGKFLRERSDWKRLCRKCHAKMDLHLKARGEKQGSSKLTEKQVRVIKWVLYYGGKEWGILTYLARVFNVSLSSISTIKRGEIWEHVKI